MRQRGIFSLTCNTPGTAHHETKVRNKEPHWRKQEAILEQYLRLCERFHVPRDLYAREFSQTADGLVMSFRKDVVAVSKENDLVAMQPIRHWTDNKIRCHFFSCVVAMTYLRRIELRLNAAGVHRTVEDVMEDMQHLHSVLVMKDGGRKANRQIEIPTKTQAEVLSALGFIIDAGGVLRSKIS
ncbi:MAG: transposase [Deltaproteobacteria bacterium]|nr:transposase [Deltaproteobacteria bacterium]